MTSETRTEQAPPQSPAEFVEPLIDRYRDVRRFTMKLCEPLGVEDLVFQSMPDANLNKWHIAHTIWFFETFILSRYDPAYGCFYDAFGFLFNSCYNAIGERVARPMRGMITGPTVEEIVQCRRHVDDAMVSLIHSHNLYDNHLHHLIVIGLHHDQQHQELLVTGIK